MDEFRAAFPRAGKWGRLFLTGLLLQAALYGLITSGAFAEEPPDHYPTLKLSHPVSRAFQKITGITLLTRLIANSVAEKVISQDVAGDLDVSIRPYSSGDLFSGKIHGLRLTGQNLLIDDTLPVSRLEAETDDKYNIYVRRSKKPMLMLPVLATVKAEITEADLNRFLTSEKAQDWLSDIKVPLPPFSEQRLDCLKPEVRFEDGKVVLASLVNVHGAPLENAVPVEALGRIGVADDHRLRLTDVDLKVEGLEETDSLERFAESYFDHAVEDLLKMSVDGHKVKVRIRQAEIVDDRLMVEAEVEAKPGKELLQKLHAESLR